VRLTGNEAYRDDPKFVRVGTVGKGGLERKRV
jgi:hypothetical protein